MFTCQSCNFLKVCNEKHQNVSFNFILTFYVFWYRTVTAMCIKDSNKLTLACGFNFGHKIRFKFDCNSLMHFQIKILLRYIAYTCHRMEIRIRSLAEVTSWVFFNPVLSWYFFALYNSDLCKCFLEVKSHVQERTLALGDTFILIHFTVQSLKIV